MIALPATAILVDDEADARSLLRLLLAEYPEISITAEAANATEAY